VNIVPAENRHKKFFFNCQYNDFFNLMDFSSLFIPKLIFSIDIYRSGELLLIDPLMATAVSIQGTVLL